MSSSSASIVANHRLAVPQHLEAELELVLHLVEHVGERAIGGAQKGRHVVAGLEHRAERHRQHGVLAHDRFVDPLMGEHVVAGRVEHAERRVGDDGRQVVAAHGVDRGRFLADADRPERERLVGADDAVDVAADAGAVAGAGRRTGGAGPRARGFAPAASPPRAASPAVPRPERRAPAACARVGRVRRSLPCFRSLLRHGGMFSPFESSPVTWRLRRSPPPFRGRPRV